MIQLILWTILAHASVAFASGNPAPATAVTKGAGRGSLHAVGMLSDGKMTQQRIQFARVGRIELGPFVVDSPRVIIAPSQLEGDNWGHHLIIGYGFMRNYVVTFDYPGKTITLQR